MDNNSTFEKENNSRAQFEGSNTNIVHGDIEIDTPHVSIGEEIALTHGPDPILIEPNDSGIVIVDVDSDMYGGPLPEDFYIEDHELTELVNMREFIAEASKESDYQDNEKKSDIDYFNCDNFIC